MGDRVLVQLKSNNTEVSPVLYGHWSGDAAEVWLHQLIAKMGGRLTDLSYSFARLAQIAMGSSKEEVTGFGIWNQEKELIASDSHGDAGIYILNVDTREITHLGQGLNMPNPTFNQFLCEHIKKGRVQADKVVINVYGDTKQQVNCDGLASEYRALVNEYNEKYPESAVTSC